MKRHCVLKEVSRVELSGKEAMTQQTSCGCKFDAVIA